MFAAAGGGRDWRDRCWVDMVMEHHCFCEVAQLLNAACRTRLVAGTSGGGAVVRRWWWRLLWPIAHGAVCAALLPGLSAWRPTDMLAAAVRLR